MAIELLTPFTKVKLEPEVKAKKRKQVGILGGNFNPVHNAHLVVADQVRQQLCLDQVLLMPEYEPPHVDKKSTIDEKHRLKMLKLAIEGIEGLGIETIELERKGISYTYDTMKFLTEKHPDTDYYFIIGADMVDYLPKWHRIDELVDFSDIVNAHDEIRKLSKVKVTGTGQLQGKKVVFNLHIEGTMTLACALTLDDVEYPFDYDSVEVFVLDADLYEEGEDEYLVTGTTIELAPVIWQNILLQKPLRVVKEGAYEEMKKKGIEFETEEDLHESEAEPKVDPRLAVLSKLLNDTQDN